MAVEEISCRVIGRKPIPVQQKIMHVIRENELFDLHAFFAQPRHEVHCLCEVDVAVVVAVNEKHGRFPPSTPGNRPCFSFTATTTATSTSHKQWTSWRGCAKKAWRSNSSFSRMTCMIFCCTGIGLRPITRQLISSTAISRLPEIEYPFISDIKAQRFF